MHNIFYRPSRQAMEPLWGLHYLSFRAEIFSADFTILFSYECQLVMRALQSTENIHSNSNSTAPTKAI